MLLLCTCPLQIRPQECIHALSAMKNKANWFIFISLNPKYATSDLVGLIEVLEQVEFTVPVIECALAIQVEMRSRGRKMNWSNMNAYIKKVIKVYHTATLQTDRLVILIMEGLVDNLKINIAPGTIIPQFFKYFTMIDEIDRRFEGDRTYFNELLKVILEDFDVLFICRVDYTEVTTDFTISEMFALCNLTNKRGMKFVFCWIARYAAEYCREKKMKKECTEFDSFLNADVSGKM